MALIVEAVSISETSVDIYQITRSNIPDDSQRYAYILHNHGDGGSKHLWNVDHFLRLHGVTS
jgi:hypothetical protein